MNTASAIPQFQEANIPISEPSTVKFLTVNLSVTLVIRRGYGEEINVCMKSYC